ncbi:MAG: branched-chain amino acid ABC transporter permease, partial [Anaerotignum sp.]|nr:branched-chain amino acid ABC transporter permease [Anaerotignum sp.]
MTEQKKQKLSILLSIAGVAVLFGLLVCVDRFTAPTYMLRTVLQLGVIYALVAVSMNLLNGFTGLFSLGQAGFMAVGAYAFAIFTIPVESRAGVYYLYGVADWLANIE